VAGKSQPTPGSHGHSPGHPVGDTHPERATGALQDVDGEQLHAQVTYDEPAG